MEIDRIIKLLDDIPALDIDLERQEYNQFNLSDEKSHLVPNRKLPTKLKFRPGNNIAIRMPADLNLEESRKFEINLKRYFKDEIKFEYYKKPKDIRLTNKLEQPLTFIIATKPHLQKLKAIASEEVK